MYVFRCARCDRLSRCDGISAHVDYGRPSNSKGGETDVGQQVGSGTAVFWVQGEGHETYSEYGMTAIVIEGKELDPASYMVEEQWR
ncbi:hypothetical protein ACFSMW_15490 [Virgibacillus halophilus]|uniref:hypothetical protein n=1 Tax=Tigheibacillus halophilus TaxID=361280 RepID=UPI00364176F6